MELNNKIINIIKQHPEGGEKFFDALDLMLRSDYSIGNAFMKWINSYDYYNMKVPAHSYITSDLVPLHRHRYDLGVVLTGRFGLYLLSNYAHQLAADFKDIVVVNGGIREGNKPEIFKSEFKSEYYILLDDSHYSGTTFDAISKALYGATDSPIELVQAFVVYEGSKNRNYRVKSMFRYYE